MTMLSVVDDQTSATLQSVTNYKTARTVALSVTQSRTTCNEREPDDLGYQKSVYREFTSILKPKCIRRESSKIFVTKIKIDEKNSDEMPCRK